MTPLLLLPGMMCDARLFAPQIACFSARRVVQIAPLHGADNVSALAHSVLQHAPPQFALAGLSMGGIVAMEIARVAPERVERIALLDTNPLAETPERKALRGPQIKRALAGDLHAILRDDMKPHYLTDGPKRAQLLELCMAMGESLGARVFAEQSHALRDRPDQCKTLANCEKKALVLCGRDDSLCPVSRHEFMQQLMPRANLDIIEHAGHLPTLENPEATNRALSAWLAR